MTFFAVSAALAAMVVAISAAPGYVQSALPIEHSFPSQPLAIPTSHAPLTFQHSTAPLELSHAPIALSHAPITLPHAPIEISHAPIVQQAPLEIHQAPLQIAHAAPVAIAHEPEYHAPANYEFKYGVHDPHTHDVKEQAEKRVGDRVEGYYSLVEPDGTTRTVHYTADHQNGFNAVVQRSGHATHPVTAHKEVIPVIQKYVASAPALSYDHAPALPVGHASSYADYGSSYAANYGHGFNYGGHYGSSY